MNCRFLQEFREIQQEEFYSKEIWLLLARLTLLRFQMNLHKYSLIILKNPLVLLKSALTLRKNPVNLWILMMISKIRPKLIQTSSLKAQLEHRKEYQLPIILPYFVQVLESLAELFVSGVLLGLNTRLVRNQVLVAKQRIFLLIGKVWKQYLMFSFAKDLLKRRLSIIEFWVRKKNSLRLEIRMIQKCIRKFRAINMMILSLNLLSLANLLLENVMLVKDWKRRN